MTEGGPLDDRLARLRDAADAGRSLGLEEEAAAARHVARRVGRRAGFGGEVYVMALAGGTGVGKSSILNALASEAVSEVRAIRPTTDRPLAWVAEDRRSEISGLLEWLKVDQVVTHASPALSDIAILDLPDVDSVRPEHRALVDTLLPRIDAVTWIVDPEKYDDERVHAYWRSLVLHADRLRFVLNKSDRLTDDEARAVADDLRGRLVADGIPRPVLHVVSAKSGDGIERLREELAEAAHAKVIVAAKLEADRAEAAEKLARTVGIDPEVGYRPLLAPARRELLVGQAVDGALSLVDPAGVGREVRDAVLHRAQLGGGSVLRRAIALAGSWSGGRRARGGDPAAYLAAWRTRGALGRVLNPVRAALVEAVGSVPAESRGRLLEVMGSPSADADLDEVLERVTRAEAASVETPRLRPVAGHRRRADGGRRDHRVCGRMAGDAVRHRRRGPGGQPGHPDPGSDPDAARAARRRRPRRGAAGLVALAPCVVRRAAGRGGGARGDGVGRPGRDQRHGGCGPGSGRGSQAGHRGRRRVKPQARADR